jgi:hypothetical protein
MSVDAVLAVFLARMAGGYAACLALVGPNVDKGPWPKVSLFVIAALSIVAFAAGAPWMAALGTAAAALLLERWLAFGKSVGWTVALAPFGVWLVVATEWGRHPGFDSVASALAVGGSLAAMLLGHGYLTARGLSFKPLRHVSLLLLGILVCRAFTVAPVFFAYDNVAMMDWVFISMRTALGLLLPLVLAWMVYQCVKIESNQSATGILYAVTVLVAVFGELIAVYLKLNSGIEA